MKPLNRKNYGSIPHLSNSKLGIGDHFIGEGQEKILTIKTRDKHDEVFVFEKYDGSNVGIGKFNDKIFALTRSGYEAKTSPYKQHHLFSDWVNENNLMFDEMLKNGERISGEWLAKSHGIKYQIHKRLDPIIFFDYFNSKNERMSFEFINDKAKKYNIKLPRLLHNGCAVSVNDLMYKLNMKTFGIISEENPEGMVYRVERKGVVDFLAKWVRQDFEAGKYMEDETIWNINL